MTTTTIADENRQSHLAIALAEIHDRRQLIAAKQDQLRQARQQHQQPPPVRQLRKWSVTQAGLFHPRDVVTVMVWLATIVTGLFLGTWAAHHVVTFADAVGVWLVS